ncbi:hypothetical protein RHGRI_005672 [Rhododendron griersonianum]|uniref:Transposase-associated domain-containing protein n=1 Tax=Rhododendron griersonianum TaxID=479676 RepID=A0AAV6LG18_9ERIC|nr:hypothetical protein RHGRI_005672 [Rhododendron griersonianum]
MPPSETLIWCPCIRCNNFNKMTPDEAEEHMYGWGVVVAYNRWVYHGEEFDQENNGHGNTNIEEESITVDAMQEILDDVRAEQFTNDWTDSSAAGHDCSTIDGDHLEHGDTILEYCGTPNWLLKMQEKCDKYKDSRSKPRNQHVAGSKAFYKVKNHLKKKNDGVNPDLPETWKKIHYSEKRKCWTDGSETVYKKLKDVQDQAMANGSVPLTDEELSCTIFGPKPGYIRGLGHGPKPSLTKSGQTSRAQLIRDAEEAREETTAAQKKCEEALVEATQARKNIDPLVETIANMQSQLNFLLQQNGRNMPSNDASEYLFLAFIFIFTFIDL